MPRNGFSSFFRYLFCACALKWPVQPATAPNMVNTDSFSFALVDNMKICLYNRLAKKKIAPFQFSVINGFRSGSSKWSVDFFFFLVLIISMFPWLKHCVTPISFAEFVEYLWFVWRQEWDLFRDRISQWAELISSCMLFLAMRVEPRSHSNSSKTVQCWQLNDWWQMFC